MTHRHFLALLAAALLLLVFAVGSLAAGAATLTPAPGSTGWDVSYPQCRTKLPTSGTFAVVGVNAGRPYSLNPCLGGGKGEYAWAASRGTTALYMNTANPAPSSSYYWPTSNTSDPVLCVDSTSTTDPGCAYDYGWHAAENALAAASAAIGPVAGQIPWWLDVETGNSWNGDGVSNAADIQGAIDLLHSRGVPVVGVYSTSYQWGVITGGYTVVSAQTYLGHWSAEFAPQVPLSDVPGWVAGAVTARGAAANCKTSFMGTPTRLAQYASNKLDADLAC
jgi:hypothetical protein